MGSDASVSGFDRFWSAYPRKVAKLDAKRAWDRLNPDVELVSQILDALDWQRRQESWCRDDGQYIPYPATWLRRGQYDDEPPPSMRPRIEVPACDHEPPCTSKLWCRIVRERAQAKAEV